MLFHPSFLIQLFIKQLQGIRFNTMDGRISMCVLLVCVWCSLDAGGHLMVVAAQPTVSAVILTPEADRKEGGQVDMRCTATNLESDHMVEWVTLNKNTTLKFLTWKQTSVTTESRFFFNTTEDTTRTTVQDFTIVNVQRVDSNKYLCKVIDPKQDGGYDFVASSSVILSVLYFPNASFPICSPAGPITVDAGTVLNMRCTSESSHRSFQMIFNPTILTARSTPWTSQYFDDNNTLIRTSDLKADVADECIAFECLIRSMYFPNKERSCTIGPITINHPTTELAPSRTPCVALTLPISSTETDQPTTSTLSHSAFNDTSMLASSPSSPAVIAGAVAGGVAALLLILIVILILICSKRRLGNSDTKSAQSNLDTNQTNTDLTLRLDNSQVSLNEYGELGTIQDELQNNNLYTSTQHHDADASGTMSEQRAQATDPSLIYAKPLHKQTHTTSREAMMQQPDQAFDSTTGQRYSNPAFVSDVIDVTTRPTSDGFSTSLKPMATVKPTQSSQSKTPAPKPYQPKSAQRENNPLSHHDNQMDPSQTPPVSTPMHPDAGTSAQEEAHPAPNNPTYAQVSPPKREHAE